MGALKGHAGNTGKSYSIPNAKSAAKVISGQNEIHQLGSRSLIHCLWGRSFHVGSGPAEVTVKKSGKQEFQTQNSWQQAAEAC